MRALLRHFRTLRFQKFVHPPHPPVKIFLLLLVALLSRQSAKAQMMPFENYALATKAYYNKLWTAERAEYVNIQRGKSWNLVPSFGLVFGLPSVNLNTGQIAAFKARQAETKAKLLSIDLRYELLLNEQLNSVRIAREKLANEQAKLEILSSTNATRELIFKIYKEAYQKHELKPLDYYKEKLSNEQAQALYLLAVREFAVRVLELEQLAHFSMPTEQIAYDGATELEGATSLMEVEPSKLPQYLITKPSQRQRQSINPLGN